MQWSALFIVLISVYLYGIYLFVTGFFLTRLELNSISHCSDTHARWPCWSEKSYEKVVIIMIDALRYDFVAPADAKKAICAERQLATNDYEEGEVLDQWCGFSSILNELDKNPRHAVLYKSLADTPTVTMQRIKAITSGTLPTFLDIAHNFDTGEIKEDNILRQMLLQGMPAVFVGDDTWMKVFPGDFLRYYPFPSFDVKDLHTVDRGCIRNLFPELKRMVLEDYDEEITQPIADLLLVHFLGVDHVGHRYSADHTMMRTKLLELDHVVQKVINTIKYGNKSDNILLIVMGDHGMTVDGNHGGESNDEINTPLFLYSKSANFVCNDYPCDTINQIDLVPTLSLLLGLPIPYSNIGQIISSLFVGSEINSFNRIEALWSNCFQIWRYFQHYNNRTNVFTKNEINELNIMYKNMKILYDQIINQQQKEIDENFHDVNDNHNIRITECENKLKEFLNRCGQLAREKWTTFDTTLMTIGFVASALSCFGLILLVYIGWSSSMTPSGQWLQLLKMIIPSLLVGCLFAFSQRYSWIKSYSIFSDGMIIAYVILIRVGWWLYQHNVFNIYLCKKLLLLNAKNYQWSSVCAIIILIVYFHGLFSNSFIDSELSCIRFSLILMCLTTSFSLCNIYQKYPTETPLQARSRTSVIALSSLYHISTSPFGSFMLSISLISFMVTNKNMEPLKLIEFPRDMQDWYRFLEIIKLICVPIALLTFTLDYLWSLTSLPIAASKRWCRVHFFSWCVILFSQVASSVYWVDAYLFDSTVSTTSPKIAHQIVSHLPLLIYFISAITLLLFVIISLIEIKMARTCKIRFQLRILLTALSIISCNLALLLGVQFPATWVALFILVNIQTSAWGYIDSHNLTLLSSNESTFDYGGYKFHEVVFMWLLMLFSYFCTGHDNTLSSLHTNAAFVGFDEFHYYWAIIMLLLNTYGGPILVGMLILIGLLWKAQYLLDNNDDGDRQSFYKRQHHQVRAFANLVCLFFARAVYSSVNVVIQRGHLMEWGVFAPKCILDLAASIVMAAGFILVLTLSDFQVTLSSKFVHKFE